MSETTGPTNRKKNKKNKKKREREEERKEVEELKRTLRSQPDMARGVAQEPEPEVPRSPRIKEVEYKVPQWAYFLITVLSVLLLWTSFSLISS